MRRVVGGGDVVPARLLRDLGEVFPEARLRIFYGPTETTVSVSSHDVGAEAFEHVTIGRPLRNVRLYVCDRTGEPVGVGIPGELLVGGGTVARGYPGRADLTAERFIQFASVVSPSSAASSARNPSSGRPILRRMLPRLASSPAAAGASPSSRSIASACSKTAIASS